MASMAIHKRGVNAVIVLLFLVLLYALNPSTEDFQAWRSDQAREQVSGGSTGVFKKGLGAIAGAAAGIGASGYKRRDLFFCSTYSLGRESYLGVARIFFKLK
jgi:hypothetical protein